MTAGTPTHERSEDGTESVTAAGTPDSEPDVPPGPDGYPIVGNTLEIMREPFEFLDELATYL